MSASVNPDFELAAAAKLYETYLEVSRTANSGAHCGPEFLAPRPAPLTLTFS